MHRLFCACCLSVILTLPCMAQLQRAPARKPPPPAVKPAKPPTPARPDAPKLPPGSKAPTIETAQKETQRLRSAIERLEQRIAAKEADKSGDGATPATSAAAKEKAAPPEASSGKRTLAGVEMENKLLRKKLDKLLVRAAELEGTIPARPAGAPPYDPHVIDSPTNASFCHGKKLEELEDTMRFSGALVAEKGDELFYEWTIHVTNAKQTAHATHRLWAQIKDGVALNTMEAEPGQLKEGPPPRLPQ